MGYESASVLLEELNNYSDKLKQEEENIASIACILNKTFESIDNHLDKTNKVQNFLYCLLLSCNEELNSLENEKREEIVNLALPVYGMIEKIIECDEISKKQQIEIADKRNLKNELENECTSLEQKKDMLAQEIASLSNEKKKLEIEISNISKELANINDKIKNKEIDLEYQKRDEISKTIKENDIEKAYQQRLLQEEELRDEENELSNQDEFVQDNYQTKDQTKDKVKKSSRKVSNTSIDNEGKVVSGFCIPMKKVKDMLYICDEQGYLPIGKSGPVYNRHLKSLSTKYENLGKPQFRLLFENKKWFAISQQYKENLVNGYSLAAEGKIELHDNDKIRVKDSKNNYYDFLIIIG